MAKVKSSGLRNYIGRLGGSVYYMLKGQNIAREKAPEVSNPRTAMQMRQRMQWANLVAMYKCIKPYLGKKSFQNKLATWSDYNAFMSANLGATPVYLTKDMVQNGHALLAPYKVTEGSLPTIGGAYRESSTAFDTEISLGGNMTFDDTTTIGALSDRIIGNNMGWQRGDQLGIVIMQNGRMYRPYTHAFELILDPSDEHTIEEVLKYDDLLLSNNGNLSIDVDVLENPTQGLAKAIAVIHSRTISGKTSVSTQSLVLNTPATTEYNEATTEEAFNYARESYGIPTEVWLDSGYQGESGGAPTELALDRIVAHWYGDAASESKGQTSTYEITPGGRNGIQAAGDDCVDQTTQCTCYLNRPLETGKEYCLVFIPQGDEENNIVSQVTEAPKGELITFTFRFRTDVAKIEFKAGRYAICLDDVYEAGKVVVEMSVTA